MQDYNQNRNGRSLRNILSSLRWKAAKPSGKDEAVDYNWLMEFKKNRGNYIEITASYVICGREFRPQKYLQREREDSICTTKIQTDTYYGISIL